MPTQKILIVDDSKTIRCQIKDMLPTGNFEVLEAKDGVEALDAIIQRIPNLILLDFFMPRMNGWEVVQKIQSHPRLQHIPVVMMSGRKEDVQKTVPELFDYFEFLAKPFDATVLVKAIQIANSKARQRKTLPPSLMNGMGNSILNGLGNSAALGADPALSPNHNKSGSVSLSDDDIKSELRQLKAQNSELKHEVELLKKQLRQVVLLVQQKLKSNP